jgi:hypothetical protein
MRHDEHYANRARECLELSITLEHDHERQQMKELARCWQHLSQYAEEKRDERRVVRR